MWILFLLNTIIIIISKSSISMSSVFSIIIISILIIVTVSTNFEVRKMKVIMNCMYSV